jgi:hypothetical protein
MSEQNNKVTIVSMAVIASALGTLLHEGLGHGVTAWLRGDIPTELTSNHLQSLRPDKWVDAGGTLVNLAAGGVALLGSRMLGERANVRYFLWVLAAFNLLSGAGYFMFSGIFAFGDWYEVIRGMPHEGTVRVGMTLFGAGLYTLTVWLLALGVRPFVGERKTYNVVGRLPYLAAGIFSCVAGVFDPLGLKLLFVSTIPAAFGGSSGMLWADELMPRTAPEKALVLKRAVGWWIAAAVIGISYVVVLGRGIEFPH